MVQAFLCETLGIHKGQEYMKSHLFSLQLLSFYTIVNPDLVRTICCAGFVLHEAYPLIMWYRKYCVVACL